MYLSSRSFSQALNVDDLRSLAKRRLPKAVFDYLDGGAEDEVTLRESNHVFQQVQFRPRQAVSVQQCNLTTTVLGKTISAPFLMAPIGYTRLINPDGETGAARVAGRFGIGYVLSTISGHRLEDVRAASQSPVSFQLYLMGGRESTENTLERARNAGFDALFVTVDTPVAGMRERDLRNGIRQLLGKSAFAKVPYVPNLLVHPGWLVNFVQDGGICKLENVVIPGKGPMELVDVGAALSRSVVTWEDLSWIRKIWLGPIVVKGILTGDDARRAVDAGAAGVVVSTHGGRQLDGVIPSLRALPEVVAAVGNETEVLMDGGIRRGSDIVKALCLGARAVLIGRAYAFGIAAAGEAGAAKAIEILLEDTVRTMRLLGCSSAGDLNRSYIQTNWSERPGPNPD